LILVLIPEIRPKIGSEEPGLKSTSNYQVTRGANHFSLKNSGFDFSSTIGPDLKPGFDSKNQTQFKFWFLSNQNQSQNPTILTSQKNVTCPTLQIAFHLKKT
jgi:hypothetical protein